MKGKPISTPASKEASISATLTPLPPTHTPLPQSSPQNLALVKKTRITPAKTPIRKNSVLIKQNNDVIPQLDSQLDYRSQLLTVHSDLSQNAKPQPESKINPPQLKWRKPDKNTPKDEFTVKTGPYSETERKLVHTQLKTFCKAHEIPFTDVSEFLLRRKKSTKYSGPEYRGTFKGFYRNMLLATNLSRTVVSLYDFIKKTYVVDCDNSVIDDELLIKLVERDGRDWKKIAAELGSNRFAVKQRYRIITKDYKRQDNIVYYQWTHSDDKTLLKFICEFEDESEVKWNEILPEFPREKKVKIWKYLRSKVFEKSTTSDFSMPDHYDDLEIRELKATDGRVLQNKAKIPPNRVLPSGNEEVVPSTKRGSKAAIERNEKSSEFVHSSDDESVVVESKPKKVKLSKE